MKSIRHLALTGALIALAGATVFAAEGDKSKGGPRPGRGPGVEHLLPLRVVDELQLTADQKSKLEELEAAFKKDTAAWDKEHPNFRDEMRKARESGDKESARSLAEQRKPLFEKRKGYVDQFRASLTEAQKATLDKEVDKMKKGPGKKGPRGDKAGGPPPPRDE